MAKKYTIDKNASMQNMGQTMLRRLLQDRRARRVTALLGCVVLAVTVWRLTRPAVTWEAEAFCGCVEHVHKEDCFETVLACGLEEHEHSEACYGEGYVCGLEEHEHTDECRETVETLSCTLEEHEHGDGCYTETRELTCEEEEHSHGPDCYDEEGNLVCELEEHAHEDACYEISRELTCEQEEHTHDADCYTTEEKLTCGYEEHSHGEDCVGAVLLCGIEAHTHTEGCYEQSAVCGFEAHIHSLACYSNPEADTDGSYWQGRVPEAQGAWRTDLLRTASSQIGYAESKKNYEVQPDGRTMKGYTIYGDFCGVPYGDWCAAFLSWCIDVSGVDMPTEVSCSRWVSRLSRAGLYTEGPDVLPDPGDLVFFDFDGDGAPEHVGLAREAAFDEDFRLKELKTIEGNSADSVREVSYRGDELAAVCGAARIPEKDAATGLAVERDAWAGGADTPEAPEERLPERELLVQNPTMTFTGGAGGIEVFVEAESGAFKSEVTMMVRKIRAERVLDAVTDAVSDETDAEIALIEAVDISFYDDNDDEVEPLMPLRVTMRSGHIGGGAEPFVVHVDRRGEAEVMDTIPTAYLMDEDTGGEVIFETDAFSVYALVYTVDFHAGNYDCSLPGGGAIGLRALLEQLGLAEDAGFETVDAFLSEVEAVTFSNPALVWVGRAEADTTVGEIKAVQSLEVQYTALLTEEEIAAIDALPVPAGTWVLISLAPFGSEETLTITLANGQSYTIAVTDAAYQATLIDVLDGATGALVNHDNSNAVQGAAHSTAGRLQAAGVTYTLSGVSGTVTANDLSTAITEWSFTRVGESGSSYYIHCPGGYMNISFGSVTLSDTPQALTVQTNANRPNQIRITDGSNNALNNHSNVTANGYSAYNGSNATNNLNPGEWFHVLGLTYATLHFVDEDGHPIDTVTFNGETITGGTYTIDSGNLHTLFGDGDILKLKDFTADGLTLSNTHRGTYLDLFPDITTPAFGADTQQPHTIIGNELRLDGSTLQYRAFYTNHDKAGSTWMNVGYRPQISDFDASGHPGTPQQDGILDYYLVYSPTPEASGIKPGTGGLSTGDLGEIDKEKKLTSNDDGTYTMELSVTTQSLPKEHSNGVNVIVVFDTSSSMRRSVNNADKQYDPGDFKNHSDSRFMQARSALAGFLSTLCSANTATRPNAVELALVDFNYGATTHTFGSSYWTSSDSAFMAEVDALSCPSGTNWAEGLESAKAIYDASDKDPTYVLLMTDGAPSQYWDPGALDGAFFVDGGGCHLGAMDEARAVINGGMELYGIFSFGDETDRQNGYLTDLVRYAYNNDTLTDHSYYASDTNSLVEALSSILSVVTERVAHTGVNYHDGIALDTTSAALKVNVGAPLGSITYSKSAGTTPAYSVTVDSSGNATFTIGGETYPGTTGPVEYTRLSGSGDAITATTDTATVYQCTVPSGAYAGTYYMPIATLETDSETQVGDLNWDLSPLGLLEDEVTYKISFVVWPEQKAYDYVADLNNGKKQWNYGTEEEVRNESGTLLYYKKGVAEFPNIVRGTDGVFSVLTNTVQEVTYYKADENSLKPTEYSGIHHTEPPAPDPMPLTFTRSRIEKQWNVERDPATLAHLLYGGEDKISLTYSIHQDGTLYTSVTLGWDETLQKYVWEDESEETVYYNDSEYTIGTLWTDRFALAAGLMLSEARMDALGLDKNRYPSGSYNGTTWYVLESGHDYTIEESGIDLGYEFDFVSPVYHPMVADGKLQSATFTRDGMSITITEMTEDAEGLTGIRVENTLRGYINLEKRVLDKNGVPDPADETKFEYLIDLATTRTPEPFTIAGDHVPWYGINGLFYHDEDFNYYQARPNGVGHVTLTDEDGNVFDATCAGTFAESVGPEEISWMDGGVPRTIQLYGNQMLHDSDSHVHATLKICQGETLSISNVPFGTVYTITETAAAGYDFVDALVEIRNGSAVEKSTLITGSPVVTGTIAADRDNHVIYTNKVHSADITVKKFDDGSPARPLTGAVFTLTKARSGDETADTVWTRPAAGETDSAVYRFADLPDGSYTLSESAAPAGYGAIGDVTFNIVSGTVTDVSTPAGGDVTWNAETLTFTVKDEQLDNGMITVRKEWLDFFGEPTDYNGTIDLNIIQWAQDIEIRHTVTVTFRYRNNSGSWVTAATRTATGYGDATVEWMWNTHTSSVESIEPSGGATYESLGEKRFRLTIPNTNTDTEIFVDVINNGYDPWSNYSPPNPYDGSIFNVQIGSTPSPLDGMSATGGEKTITLGTGGVWYQQIAVTSDDGLLSDASETLPATYNGRNCYYSITEDTNSLPEGYMLYQISTERITSGVLTAYNRKTSLDLTILKVDRTNRYRKLDGAVFALRQLDPEATGNLGMRTLAGGRMETGTTADGGKLTFTDLAPGYYEIKETSAPVGYVLHGETAFYIRVTAEGIDLLEKAEGPAKDWGAAAADPGAPVTLAGAAATVTNTPGTPLPSAGGRGYDAFTLAGGAVLLTLGTALAMKRRRRHA